MSDTPNYRILKHGEEILPGDEWLDDRDNEWKARASNSGEILNLSTEGGVHLPHRRKVDYPEHTPPAPPEGMKWEYVGKNPRLENENFYGVTPDGMVAKLRWHDNVGFPDTHYFEAVPVTKPRCEGCGGVIISRLCSCGTPHPEFSDTTYHGSKIHQRLADLAVAMTPEGRSAFEEDIAQFRLTPEGGMERVTENPKEAAGRAKCPMHLLSPSAMRETANALGHGAAKYQARNYRKAGINATTYVGAILRHISAWNDGEDNDPESGLSHIAHVSACCDILLDCQATGMMNDDRSKKL